MSDPADVTQSLLNSICRHCRHRVTRVVIPYDCGDYGIMLDDNDIASSTSIVIEHNVCLELDVDLDCDVLECSRFQNDIKRAETHSLIKGDLP